MAPALATVVLYAATVAGADPSAPPSPLDPLREEAPVEFVCDAMQLFSKPNRAVCTHNVVVRRGDILLCCDRFEGLLDERGVWQRLTCSDRVRAQRGDELMWADRAVFEVASARMTLTGDPRVHRGRSVLRGERIVVDTRNDRARIEQPRGRVEPAANAPAPIPPPALEGELPRRCPVPAAPP